MFVFASQRDNRIFNYILIKSMKHRLSVIFGLFLIGWKAGITAAERASSNAVKIRMIHHRYTRINTDIASKYPCWSVPSLGNLFNFLLKLTALGFQSLLHQRDWQPALKEILAASLKKILAASLKKILAEDALCRQILYTLRGMQ